MELFFSFSFWCTTFMLAAVVVVIPLRWIEWRNRQRHPPGPKGWPVIGNMLDLGLRPHQTFFKLRAKYGPDLLWLKLGSMNTLVVQSARAAEQLLKIHDQRFSDRICPYALTSHNYAEGTLALARYGPYWKALRRLSTFEVLAAKRVNDTVPVRRKCLDAMLRYVEQESDAARARGESGSVNLGHYLFLMGFNMIGNLVFSKDLLEPTCKEGKEFYDAMDKIMEFMTTNMADFFPLLKWLDPRGVKANTSKHLAKALEIAEKFLNERVDEIKLGRQRDTKDFMDVLLEHESHGNQAHPLNLSRQNIAILLLEMFMAGSETTSSSVEWAMTELFRNPKSMQKAKEELNRVIGPNRKVEESDIDDLPYLQAVVKESMRLHPPVHLLIPRNTIEDTNFMGYLIPKDTQVFVNVWAIGRDAESWDEPFNFNPERFIGSNIDLKGQNFELLPFGSGRRMCAGMSLALRVVHLTLASLLHTFEWNFDPDKTFDTSERVGITLRRLIPLHAIPKKISLTE